MLNQGSYQKIKKALYLSLLLFYQIKAQERNDLKERIQEVLDTPELIGHFQIQTVDSKDQPSFFGGFSFVQSVSDGLVLKEEKNKKSDKDVSEKVINLGFTPESISYSYTRSKSSNFFGLNKDYHITYTPLVSVKGGLTHYLIYYSKKNLLPEKILYYKGSLKIRTIEYFDFKKIGKYGYRSFKIISEDHISLKRSTLIFDQIEVIRKQPILAGRQSAEENNKSY